MSEIELAWERAVPGEVAFWKRIMTDGQREKCEKNCILRAYFCPMMEGRIKVNVLDVACGAYPTGGWTWPGVEVQFTQADALAKQYLALYDKLGITPPLPIEEQNMCSMTYPDASFDIVHCRNAVNHCADPFSAIREMVRVSREWVCLAHGEAAYRPTQYKDMHLWRISMAEDGKDVKFWGRDGDFLLSECAPGFRNYSDSKQYQKCNIVMSYLHLD